MRAPRLLASLLVAAASMTGCRGASEYAIASEFFSASRLLDKTALANVATVVFDPRADGTVTSFTIERVSPERRDGGPPSKEATLSAVVRQANGETATKTLVLTMKNVDGRWMIVDFRPRARPF